MLNDLSNEVLDLIVGFVPLRARCSVLTLVCRKLRDAVNRSVTNVCFYEEALDSLSDEKIRFFLKGHAASITRINFDLFRSTSFEESTQWLWRQSVVNIARSCKNLRELDLMVCNRHRMRDKDLEAIFKECSNLKVLKVDAQYLSGHCFKFAPPLRRLEMEMCNRINDEAMQAMFYRLRSLRALYVSQLHLLSDKIVKQMVRCWKNLREISIVSHPETNYGHLTGYGICLLAGLSLKTLLLEGLGAVTDQFLSAISNEKNPIAATLTNLSLAFSFNVSNHGLKRLATLKRLENLNLDGITRRDISLGVEAIAQTCALVRLFLAECSNVSPESLFRIITASRNLRLLDVTNNEGVLNWISASQWVSFWAASGRPPLSVLTDNHLIWNVVSRPPADVFGRPPVRVVHTCLPMVPLEEVMPTTMLCAESPLSLPPGTLCSKVRKGNRYRAVFMHLGPEQKAGVTFFGEQDQELPLVGAFDTQAEAYMLSGGASFEPILPPMAQADVFRVPLGSLNTLNVLNNGDKKDYANTPRNGVENGMPAVDVLSMGPANSHASDWSVDVMNLLLTTHAFEDGARVGESVVKEGLLFSSDGTLSPLQPSSPRFGTHVGEQLDSQLALFNLGNNVLEGYQMSMFAPSPLSPNFLSNDLWARK